MVFHTIVECFNYIFTHSPPHSAWLTEVGVLKGGEGGSSDKAKVSNFHSTIQGEEDVGGLQVPVHHAFLVDIKHCI